MKENYRPDQRRETWPPVDRWPPADARLHADHWQHADGESSLSEWLYEDQWLPLNETFAGLNDDDSY